MTPLLAIPGAQGRGRGFFHFCHFNQPGRVRRHPQLHASGRERGEPGRGAPLCLSQKHKDSPRLAWVFPVPACSPSWPGTSPATPLRRKRASNCHLHVRSQLGGTCGLKEKRDREEETGSRRSRGGCQNLPGNWRKLEVPAQRPLSSTSEALPSAHLQFSCSKTTGLPCAHLRQGGPSPSEPPTPTPSPHRPAPLHREPDNTG